MDAIRIPLILLIVHIGVSACSAPVAGTSRTGGGYYGGDGPPDHFRNIESIPDAVPQIAPVDMNIGANKPYTVLGKRYYPLKTAKGFAETGIASWYGKKFHGRRTSSGERYDMWKMTAAHPTLPIPTWVRVTSLEHGNSVIVKVNDRGPFLHDRVIDLSYAAARKLGIAGRGTGRVRVSAIDPTAHTGPAVRNLEVAPRQSPQVPEPVSAEVFLQIGSYDNLERALNMHVWLKAQGFNVHPKSGQQLETRGRPYRVQTGPYTVGDALEIQRLLQKLLSQPVLMTTR